LRLPNADVSPVHWAEHLDLVRGQTELPRDSILDQLGDHESGGLPRVLFLEDEEVDAALLSSTGISPRLIRCALVMI
jgi:hypothetical protein